MEWAFCGGTAHRNCCVCACRNAKMRDGERAVSDEASEQELEEDCDEREM